MKLGKWTLALAVLLVFGGTAMAQIEANRLCMHNGGDYYIIGYEHGIANNGAGKYYPSFAHWAGTESDANPGTYPWKLRGWAWVGMQANVYGPTWFWLTGLYANVDNPYATTMSFDYPFLYCSGAVPHSGSPRIIYGGNMPGNVPSVIPSPLATREIVFPSSYGGFDAYLNLFWFGTGTWSIASTQPYYGWQFAFTTTAPTVVELPSMTSIWQYTWEDLGPIGQYEILSGNEMACTLTAGGNKGRNYAVINIGDAPYYGYWANNCTGGDSNWAQCLFVEDAVTIPVNVPGDAGLSNPFAYYGYAFDVAVSTVTPAAQSGSAWLQAYYEDYANPGTGRALIAGSPWVGLIPLGTMSSALPYGPAGFRVGHPNDLVTGFFITVASIWQGTVNPGFPACMFGTTTAGISIPVPIPPLPELICFELRYSGFSFSGKAPTASYYVCYWN
jgi:hypothetical protein